MLMSILKGQYDSFTGNEVTIFLKQQSFKGKWKDLFVFMVRNDKMFGNMYPLDGCFLHSIIVFFVYAYWIGNGNYGVVLL